MGGPPTDRAETVRMVADGADLLAPGSPAPHLPPTEPGWLRVRVAELTDALERQVAENARLEARLGEVTEIVRALPQIVWVTRPDGWHTYFNQNWLDFTGLTLEESLGHGWNPPLHPEDRARAADRWAEAVSTGEPYEIEYRLRRHDGVYHWMLGRARPLRDEDGEIVRWFGTCTDIEELKAAQAREGELLRELEVRATHDPLTGLANRSLLFDRLELLLRQRERAGLAVAFVDLDDFKTVNDDFGHVEGDRVLVEVGNRLRATVREGDVVARIGGDEFVVVGEADDEAGALALRDRLTDSVAGPLSLGVGIVEVRASVGVAFVPRGVAAHADDLLSHADRAMYEVKRAPRR